MHQLALKPFAAAALTAIMICASAGADIVGFKPGSYEYNFTDSGSPPAVGPDFIQLTTGRDQRRSIWFKARQDISEFRASFTYRASSINACGNIQGLTFAIQNNPAGLDAIGSSLGNLFGPYGMGYQGLAASAAVTFELNTGSARTYSGFFKNGVLGGGSELTMPVNAFGGRDINVSIAYDGSILTVTMADSVTGSMYTRSRLVGSLADAIGSDTAYIGFTASTGGGSSSGGANQYLSNFRYAIPAPASLSILALAAIPRRRRM